MVINPNFEGGTTRKTIYWTSSGGPYYTEFGEINTPDGWTTWWIEGAVNDGSPTDQPTGRPEVQLCNRSLDPVRILTGDKAAKLFTFWRNQRCGLMQSIGVLSGKFILDAYGHGWYSECSTRPHDEPYLNDCKTKAVDSHMILRVGVSLTGSNNPMDPDIIWSAGVEQYGGYGTPCSLVFEADNALVTMFLRSDTNFALKHCDVYWDDVSLSPVPDDCPGMPRIQYKRVFNVVPVDATEEQAVGVFLDGWRRSRETTGGSYDDAGIGALDVRRARLYGIPTADRPDYEAFYAAYYPGVEVEFAWYPGETEPDQGGGDIALSQNDPRWQDADLGEAPGGETIGQAGCLLTTLTMMLRQCGETDATPPAVNKILADAGTPFVEDDLLMWPEAVALFDCFEDSRKVNRAYTAAELADLLADGWLVGLMRADGKHFVYLESIEGDAPLHIIDPWDGQRKTWTMARVGGIRAALIRGTTPEPEPPAVFNPRVLTLHLQSEVEAGLRYVQTCKPAGIKRVQGAQNLPTYAALNPGMRCVYRGMSECEDPHAFIDRHIDTLHQVADMFEARGLPLIDGHYFWFELWNEVYGYDRGPNIIWRDREIAAIQYLAELEPRVGAVAFNAGVGNIQPENFDVLVPLARLIEQTKGMFGLHSYFGAIPGRCSIDNYQDEGRWLESRWEMTDDYLVAHGVHVNWFLSEGGAIYYVPPVNMPYSSDGWKNGNCMGGDWVRYLGYLEKLAQRMYQQNLKRGGRLKAYCIFTEGGGTTWNKFELGSAEIDAIAAMQIRLWPL